VLERFEFGSRTIRRQPHASERHAQQLADVGFVINNQNTSLHQASLQVILKWAPLLDSRQSSVALFASQTSRAIYSPRPVPPAEVVKNGSKRCARIAAAMPSPSSWISVAISPPSLGVTDRRILPGLREQ